jgi:hypothetical protein
VEEHVVDSNIPVPPGAEDEAGRPLVPEAEVVDAPVVQDEEAPVGLFQRAWANMKAAVRATGGAIGTACGFAAGKVAWLYNHTAAPVLDWVEYYVPGMGQLRSAAFWYGLCLMIIGAVVGGLIFAEAGHMMPVVLLGMLFGAVLLPFLVVTTPAIWVAVFMDLWMLSVIYITIDAVADWITGRFEDGFWREYIFALAPGLCTAWVEWRARRNLEAAEVPVEAVAGAAV